MAFSTLIRLTAALSVLGTTLAKDWESPEYKWLYQYPLPIPQTKALNRTIPHPVTGKDINYYEVEIKELKQQVYPDRGPATLVGYDGLAPGPTFQMQRGTEAVVRFINKSKNPNSVHLHGSYSRAPFDGWAEDVTKPGEYKDYYYPNGQNARTLWYHDHAIDITAVNAYYGQAGVYVLHDGEESALNLPSGNYDVPLVLSSKQYNNDGSLFSPASETTSLYGDVIHVNGQPWPYFKVEPRKYRFRFLDASISRTFQLYFESDKKLGEKQDFNVIASDAGLLSAPQKVKDLYISMAERYEVVMDFSKFKGENVTLRNSRKIAADIDYLHTDKVMKFVVGKDSVEDNSVLPSSLRSIPYPQDRTTIDHEFLFERKNGGWRINGVSFADTANRVLAKPPRGKVETWKLVNGGGGWSHPIHIHLVDFKVVSRKNGRNAVMPYEAAGLKDVVWLGPNEEVVVEANYAPWDGLYMFHCHNLIHEDHEMMAAFNVTFLADLGYNETHYLDPMDPEYRAKAIKPEAFTDDAIRKRIQFMASFQPYNKVDETEAVLDAYWATKGSRAVAAAATTGSSPTKTTTTAAATTTPGKRGRGRRGRSELQ
ncbi:multicopper oxidase [Apiospora hydei]|uniref:Multicopper oxidase n=1 Tax=Apiospora hydei TaxID=1337664 RepID=A0ABR1VUX7_9PEZI